jgi:hypothetical protein
MKTSVCLYIMSCTSPKDSRRFGGIQFIPLENLTNIPNKEMYEPRTYAISASCSHRTVNFFSLLFESEATCSSETSFDLLDYELLYLRRQLSEYKFE